MFGTLGGPELFLIMVVALIVFGPRKLPEIGKSIGKMMGEFRRASNEFRRTIEDEVEAEKLREATKIDLPSTSYASEALPAAPETPSSATEEATPAAPSEASTTSSTPTAEPSTSDTESSPAEASSGLPADASKAPPGETAPPPDTVSRGDLPTEQK